MVQIRNKYHVEKKKLDTLQMESPKSSAESKWPLYEQLAFLSEHIPIRRSYRAMRAKRKYSESEYVMKSEPETDVSDADRGGDFEYRHGRKNPAQPSRSYGNSTKNYRNTSNPSAQRTAPGPTHPRLVRLPRQVYASRHAQAIYQRKTQTPPIRRSPPGSEKFYAFGQFLTSSLIELPEKEALVLVDQFTSELVQVYLSKNRENDNDKEREEEDDDDPVEVVNACNGHDNDLIRE